MTDSIQTLLAQMEGQMQRCHAHVAADEYSEIKFSMALVNAKRLIALVKKLIEQRDEALDQATNDHELSDGIALECDAELLALLKGEENV